MEQEQRIDQAWKLFNAGKYSEAAMFFEDAMRWSETNHGAEHKDTLQIRDALGKCLQKSENFKEAKDLNQETLRLREKLQGKDSLETIETRHALAVNLSRLGRYKDSIELHHLNMLYQEKSASQDYSGMLETRRSLSSDLYCIGDQEEAVKLDQRTDKLAKLVEVKALMKQDFPSQQDSIAIVADGAGWTTINPSAIEEWRRKLARQGDERQKEKELKPNKEEGKTRKGEPLKRMSEEGKKEKEKGMTEGLTENSRLPGKQKQNEEDLSKHHFNQRSKNGPINDVKKSPQINVEPPKERVAKTGAKAQPPRKTAAKPSDGTGKDTGQSDNSEVGRLSPGIHKPRAQSASIHDRIIAGFKHVSSSEAGSSAPSSPTRISWDVSQSKILEGVRHVNPSQVKDNASRPSSAEGVAGEGKPWKASKPNTKTPVGSGTGGGKPPLDQDLSALLNPNPKVHKSKSQQNLTTVTGDNRSESSGLGRSSSVSSPRNFNRQAPPLFDVQHQSYNKSLQRLADGWFLNLERYTERLIASYRNSPYEKVRIAILDTGIEKSSRDRTPDEIRSRGHRIKTGKSFVVNEPAWNQDVNGHGTHAAALLLRVAPRADIYIARILRGNEKTINPSNVVEALKCCIDEWRVDIISMSFGYEKEHSDIEKQLKRADDQNILVFAAASNDGASKPINIAWPARATSVMCVNSATGEGSNSGFNPPADPRKWNFTMLGEEVNSAWPLQLIKEVEREENGGTKRKSGTSFATPIAAATAALVLEFARQPPLCEYPKVAEYLKKFSGMQEVFMLMSERKEGKFYYVYPWKLLNSTFGKGTSKGIGGVDHDDANDRHSARGMVESSILNMVAKNVQIF